MKMLKIVSSLLNYINLRENTDRPKNIIVRDSPDCNVITILFCERHNVDRFYVEFLEHVLRFSSSRHKNPVKTSKK